MAIKWFGVRLKKEIQRMENRNLDKAAIFLRGKIQEALNVGGGPANVTRTRRRDAAGRFRKGGGAVRRSPPGGPPFKQTGMLQKSIFWRREQDVFGVGIESVASREVGTSSEYGIYHEFGIQYRRVGFQQRPFIRPTYMANRARLGRIIATGK